MRTRTARLVTLLALASAPSLAVADGDVPCHPLDTQTFELRPGWNSVWLEVDPLPRESDAVFAGLPLASVWTWVEIDSRVRTLDGFSDVERVTSDWSIWYPPERSESILTTMRSVHARQAYLLHVEGDEPVTWSVSGRRVFRSLEWIPDAYNLAGFPVEPDPALAPSFAEFFAPSAAQTEFWRLEANGEWTPVDASTTSIRRGEAYWVYCDGFSRYTGTLDVSIESGEELDFGAELLERSLHVASRIDRPTGVTVRRIDADPELPLLDWALDPETDLLAWRDLEALRVVETESLESRSLRLAVRRRDLAADHGRAMLEISDGRGTLHWVPVSVTRRTAGIAAPAFTGLWSGVVVIDSGLSEQIPTGGLLGEYWLGIDAIPGDGREPDIRRVDPAPQLPAAISAEDPESASIAIRWTGTLTIPTGDAGRYELFQRSRGSVLVFVDGLPVNVDGAVLDLSAGDHELRVEYTDSDENRLLELLWLRPQEAALPLDQRPAPVPWALAAFSPPAGAITSPAPAADSPRFSMRILVHVDDAGVARLLREATLLAETTAEPPVDPEDPDERPRFRPVVITDDALLVDWPSRFNGIGLRGGKPVGQRLSAIAFDFDDSGEAHPGTLASTSGSFGTALEFGLSLPPTHPTHPYRHRYHPDHDNLDANFEVPAPSPSGEPFREDFDIARTINLAFLDDPIPPLPNTPDWGDTVVGGTYTETIRGLHRRDLTVEGTFRLKIVTASGTLNPSAGE